MIIVLLTNPFWSTSGMIAFLVFIVLANICMIACIITKSIWFAIHQIDWLLLLVITSSQASLCRTFKVEYSTVHTPYL